MRKVWTPPWRWVFGVATALGLFSFLQAYRLTLINGRPGMSIMAGKLLVLNLALWFIPALLAPAVVWAARRFPFDSGHKLRAVLAHAAGALTFASTHILGLIAVRFLLFESGGKSPLVPWPKYFQNRVFQTFPFAQWPLTPYV